METKKTDEKKRICPCCMENHVVKRVLVKEESPFKNKRVSFDAEYSYCEKADEYFENEQQIRANDKRLKDAYRKNEGLLTSGQIQEIRAKYGVSQTDMSSILGWGAKTITRYESHQVQDKAHDAILRKIENDPEWFITLLVGAKNKLTRDAFETYFKKAASLYEEDKDLYLRKVIESEYARYYGNKTLHGNTDLSLDKTVEVIQYFASSICNLYKVKLMKLMWYADALAYKKRGSSITGLVYLALPMGAVPVGHKSIIDLKGVPCEEIEFEDSHGYQFYLNEEPTLSHLAEDEKAILDIVIEKLGNLKKDEVIEFMHNERAYKETPPTTAISFEYAKDLHI